MKYEGAHRSYIPIDVDEDTLQVIPYILKAMLGNAWQVMGGAGAGVRSGVHFDVIPP